MTAQATAAFELRQRGDLTVLAWPAFDGLAVDAIVTSRRGGVSSGAYATLNLSFTVGDRPQDVLENRRRAAAALGAGLDDCVLATQVHGRTAAIVTRADRGAGAATLDGTVGEADALVTTDPGTVLAILAADCLPIVLYDPKAHVLGCVHAGWRGTVARVTSAALAAMGTLGSRPQDVLAGLGPAIAPDRYQVGEDVAQAARESFGPQTPSVLRPDGTGKWLFDLWGANRLVLTESGVPGDHVHLAAIPTGAEPSPFFSHRAAQPCGRFAAIARLRPRDGGP